jgi:glycerophosphoryl diester phosphodiesterase
VVVPRGGAHRGSLAGPIVIGHRGAAGHRPEHTLAGYALAARMGADYVEPDLVTTKDRVLVARHENLLQDTTDVAGHPEFAGRRTTKTVDGTERTGWFTEDFTLGELKTLRARERMPELRPGSARHDGREAVPTLQEVIDLVRALSRELGRPIGIYPETKHPTYFRSLGLPLEPPLVATLGANGLDGAGARVFVQSFEPAGLQALAPLLEVPLVQLLDPPGAQPYDVRAAGGSTTYAELATPAGLAEIAGYADVVGPGKAYLIPRDADGRSTRATAFVDDAHAAGLLVHAFTFRDENRFLPLELRSSEDPAARGDASAEYERFFGLGVDGVFSDHPDTALAVRARAMSGPAGAW